MAFHVACPITCRKICFCTLGFPRGLQSEKGKNEFLQEVDRIEQFLNDPWLIKSRKDDTIQVKVPKVVVSTVLQPTLQLPAVAIGGDEAAAAASAQLKRVALQKQAAAASLIAEDYARRFESGDLVTSVDTVGEEQVQSNTKVMCRLCMRGDNEGSDRARKMLSCNSCSKKYHRGCVKSWSRNRDLFHWSSWTCPSCRICEVCHKTGDPNKFMFCKRCDASYHCYCQQPPHKNVGHGPYLCPQHTKCHSCGSTVPGNGLSLRWFLGYTCCDACGRLFVKNNYCPVCLKVYRDSEATPMVCCDICERWVHCPCDGISEAKYDQFQVNGNLQYVCPTCRGECCQIRSLEEASQELWKRRDEADKDLIASLRAAAGLPTQEEIFDISPFSDDEEVGPVLKNESGRSLKFSLKGVGDKSPKKNGKKSSSKKSKKKKVNETPSLMHSTGNYKNDKEIQYSGEPGIFSPMAGSLTEGVCSVNEATVSKQRYVEEITATNETKPSRTIKIKNNKPQSTHISVPKSVQGPKLVIHLGGKTKSTTSTPMSNDNADQVRASTKLREKNDNLIKFKNVNPEVVNISSLPSGRALVHSREYISPKNTGSLLGKRGIEDLKSTRSGSEVPVSKRSRNALMKSIEDTPTVSGDLIDVKISSVSNSQSSEKDRKPKLKFKIPKSSNNRNQGGGLSSNLKIEMQNPLPLAEKHEITYSRGQRSKRKRPEKGNDEISQSGEENNTMKDFSDASWILQKLGKDAAGKRVEIHQPSDNSWRRGTINEVFEGTSVASIALDDGKAVNFELGKQGIRFASQKQKR